MSLFIKYFSTLIFILLLLFYYEYFNVFTNNIKKNLRPYKMYFLQNVLYFILYPLIIFLCLLIIHFLNLDYKKVYPFHHYIFLEKYLNEVQYFLFFRTISFICLFFIKFAHSLFDNQNYNYYYSCYYSKDDYYKKFSFIKIILFFIIYISAIALLVNLDKSGMYIIFGILLPLILNSLSNKNKFYVYCFFIFSIIDMIGLDIIVPIKFNDIYFLIINIIFFLLSFELVNSIIFVKKKCLKINEEYSCFFLDESLKKNWNDGFDDGVLYYYKKKFYEIYSESDLKKCINILIKNASNEYLPIYYFQFSLEFHLIFILLNYMFYFFKQYLFVNFFIFPILYYIYRLRNFNNIKFRLFHIHKLIEFFYANKQENEKFFNYFKFNPYKEMYYLPIYVVIKLINSDLRTRRGEKCYFESIIFIDYNTYYSNFICSNNLYYYCLEATYLPIVYNEALEFCSQKIRNEDAKILSINKWLSYCLMFFSTVIFIEFIKCA